MLNNALRREPEIERVPIRNFLPCFPSFVSFDRLVNDLRSIVQRLSSYYQGDLEGNRSIGNAKALIQMFVCYLVRYLRNNLKHCTV